MVIAIRRDGTVLNEPASQGEVAPTLSALVLDDRALFRDCFVAALRAVQPAMRLHATFLDPMRREIPDTPFAVTLLHVGSEQPAGHAAAKVAQARQARPGAEVVVICDRTCPAFSAASEAGAQAVVAASDSGLDALVDLIERATEKAHLSDPPSPPAAPPEIAERDAHAAESTDPETLILREIAAGKSNWVIAYELGLREITLKLHIRLLMRKFNVTCRSDLALKAQALLCK